MKTLSPLNELSLEDVLEGLDRRKRKAVQALFADADVDFVVVMESDDGARRNLLTVGPTLEYPDLASLEGVELDGLRAVAFANASDRREGKSGLFRTRSMERVELLEKQVGELRLEKQRVHGELSQALGAVEQLARERILLDEKAERLSSQAAEQSGFQAQLDEREAELLKMEEDLIDRMNQMMQKEAELEQWEENLFSRERRSVEAAKGA